MELMYYIYTLFFAAMVHEATNSKLTSWRTYMAPSFIALNRCLLQYRSPVLRISKATKRHLIDDEESSSSSDGATDDNPFDGLPMQNTPLNVDLQKLHDLLNNAAARNEDKSRCKCAMRCCNILGYCRF